jgi:hypothetical protein
MPWGRSDSYWISISYGIVHTYVSHETISNPSFGVWINMLRPACISIRYLILESFIDNLKAGPIWLLFSTWQWIPMKPLFQHLGDNQLTAIFPFTLGWLPRIMTSGLQDLSLPLFQDCNSNRIHIVQSNLVSLSKHMTYLFLCNITTYFKTS